MKVIKFLTVMFAVFVAAGAMASGKALSWGSGADITVLPMGDKKNTINYSSKDIRNVGQLKDALGKDLGFYAAELRIISGGRALADDVDLTTMASDRKDRLQLVRKAPVEEEEYEAEVPGGMAFPKDVVKGPKAPDIAVAKGGGKADRLKKLVDEYTKLQAEGTKFGDEALPYIAADQKVPKDLQQKIDYIERNKAKNLWWQEFFKNPKTKKQLDDELIVARKASDVLNEDAASKYHAKGKSVPEELEKRLSNLQEQKALIREALKELENEQEAPKVAAGVPKINPVEANKVLDRLRKSAAKIDIDLTNEISDMQKELIAQGKTADQARAIVQGKVNTMFEKAEGNRKFLNDQIKRIEAALAADKAPMGAPAGVVPKGAVGAPVAAAAADGKDFQIFLKDMYGKTLTFDVTPKIQTVADLKKVIAARTGLSPESQRIILAGQSLGDDMNVHDKRSEFQQAETVHLVIRAKAAGAGGLAGLPLPLLPGAGAVKSAKALQFGSYTEKAFTLEKTKGGINEVFRPSNDDFVAFDADNQIFGLFDGNGRTLDEILGVQAMTMGIIENITDPIPAGSKAWVAEQLGIVDPGFAKLDLSKQLNPDQLAQQVSQKLLTNLAPILAKGSDSAIQAQFERVQREIRPFTMMGSSTTAVIGQIQGNQLRIASLGDSAAFRYTTKDNLQWLSARKIGAGVKDEAAASRYNLGGEEFSSKKVYVSPAIDLEPEDIIILASDGITTYLSSTEMSEIISDNLHKANAAQEIARALVEHARRNARSQFKKGYMFKVDDQTALVVIYNG